MFKVIKFALAAAAIYFAGWYIGRNSVQSANDLIEAGFTITDPEGFAVRDFEDGFDLAAL